MNLAANRYIRDRDVGDLLNLAHACIMQQGGVIMMRKNVCITFAVCKNRLINELNDGYLQTYSGVR